MSSAIRLFIKFTLGGGGGGGWGVGGGMNGSTFCEIKYMKVFFYMIRIGVGLKILARTPLPKLPTKKIKFSKQKQR